MASHHDSVSSSVPSHSLFIEPPHKRIKIEMSPVALSDVEEVKNAEPVIAKSIVEADSNTSRKTPTTQRYGGRIIVC